MAVEVAPELEVCTECGQTDDAAALKLCLSCWRPAHERCLTTCQICRFDQCRNEFSDDREICDQCRAEHATRRDRW